MGFSLIFLLLTAVHYVRQDPAAVKVSLGWRVKPKVGEPGLRFASFPAVAVIIGRFVLATVRYLRGFDAKHLERFPALQDQGQVHSR